MAMRGNMLHKTEGCGEIDPAIHWIRNFGTACGVNGAGGVEISSATDPAQLRLTCSDCAARFLMEVRGE